MVAAVPQLHFDIGQDSQRVLASHVRVHQAVFVFVVDHALLGLLRRGQLHVDDRLSQRRVQIPF